MSKAKITNMPKSKKAVSLIDVHIELPKESKHLTGDGTMHILFNTYAAKQVPEIKSELHKSRAVLLKHQVDDITALNDPVAIQLSLSSKLEADAIEFQAKQFYFTQIAKIDENAMFLAITNNVHVVSSIDDAGLPVQPKSYTEEELHGENVEATTDDGEVPAWRKADKKANKRVMDWPVVDYDLENIYERRLKHLNDMMAELPVTFQFKLEKEIKNHVIDAIRSMEVTDEDGFQSA